MLVDLPLPGAALPQDKVRWGGACAACYACPGLAATARGTSWSESNSACLGSARQLLCLRLPCTFLQRLEQAVAQLVLNGCSREQALDVLDEHGGDAEASLAWLLDKQAKPGMADLLANGLSAEDAEAALRKWGGDVERVRAGRAG